MICTKINFQICKIHKFADIKLLSNKTPTTFHDYELYSVQGLLSDVHWCNSLV